MGIKYKRTIPSCTGRGGREKANGKKILEKNKKGKSRAWTFDFFRITTLTMTSDLPFVASLSGCHFSI